MNFSPQVGEEVSYFSATNNRLHKAKVLKINEDLSVNVEIEVGLYNLGDSSEPSIAKVTKNKVPVKQAFDLPPIIDIREQKIPMSYVQEKSPS